MDIFDFIAGMLTSYVIQCAAKIACKCKESCECSCFDGIIDMSLLSRK